MTDLKAGSVITYPYLWHHEHEAGRKTAAKPQRPACIVLMVTNEDGLQTAFIAPLTTLKPDDDRPSVLVPLSECPSARISDRKPCWVILDDLNADLANTEEGASRIEPRGHFSVSFTNRLQNEIQKMLATADKAYTIVERA